MSAYLSLETDIMVPSFRQTLPEASEHAAEMSRLPCCNGGASSQRMSNWSALLKASTTLASEDIMVSKFDGSLTRRRLTNLQCCRFSSSSSS